MAPYRNAKKAVRSFKRSRTSIQRKFPYSDNKIFYQGNTSTFSSGGVFVLAGQITQGAGNTNRVGNRVKLTKLDYRFTFTGVDTDRNVMRLIIFYCRGAPLTSVANVFQGGSTNVNDILNLSRVIPLVDRTVCSQSIQTAAATFSYPDEILKGTIKLNKIQEYYDGTTTDANKNALQFVVISDSNAVPHPDYEWDTAIHFLDT